MARNGEAGYLNKKNCDRTICTWCFFFTIYLLYQQFLNHTQTGCQILQGKWASTKNTCIPRSCYSKGAVAYDTKTIHYYDLS